MKNKNLGIWTLNTILRTTMLKFQQNFIFSKEIDCVLLTKNTIIALESGLISTCKVRDRNRKKYVLNV